MSYLAIGALIVTSLAAFLVAVGVIGTLRAQSGARRGYIAVAVGWSAVLATALVVLAAIDGHLGS